MATTTMERRRSDGDGLASAVPPIRGGNNQLMSTVWGRVDEREGQFRGDGTAEKCRDGGDWVVAFELHFDQFQTYIPGHPGAAAEKGLETIPHMSRK